MMFLRFFSVGLSLGVFGFNYLQTWRSILRKGHDILCICKNPRQMPQWLIWQTQHQCPLHGLSMHEITSKVRSCATFTQDMRNFNLYSHKITNSYSCNEICRENEIYIQHKIEGLWHHPQYKIRMVERGEKELYLTIQFNE